MGTTQKIICLVFFLLSNSLAEAQHQKLQKNDLQQLVIRMAGEFSSEQQSIDDTSYFHIKLRMKPIWSKSKEGYWLYVEQAMAKMEDKPYRQRVYHVYQSDDSTIVSKVYEIKSASAYTGSWKDQSKLESLKKDSLVDRTGCSIYLHKNANGDFAGSTPGKECLSSLRGATYATSEVVISATKLVSWDRGWDASDLQVWGAKTGGYIFVKQKEYPVR
jgi:CpeT protein